jgi:hypothetical protein
MTDARTPRPRPRSLEELDFEPRAPISWFSPGELGLTAKKLLVSKIFGDYADKRELIGTLPDPGIIDRRDDDETWIDYVADLGDGFDATYSVASCWPPSSSRRRPGIGRACDDAARQRAGDGRRRGLPGRFDRRLRAAHRRPVPGGAATLLTTTHRTCSASRATTTGTTV